MAHGKELTAVDLRRAAEERELARRELAQTMHVNRALAAENEEAKLLSEGLKYRMSEVNAGQEALLSGSAWQLHFEGGSPFRVEFHADGHFNAPAYPAHSWYKIDGDAVFVEWGKYGQYEFVLDVAKREMNGHLRGNEKSWRRLEYTEPMAAYQKKHHCGHDH